MCKLAKLLLMAIGFVLVSGCAGLKPPADMKRYLDQSSDKDLYKRATAIDPKTVKAAEQDYTKAKEACDDKDQEMCDHYSMLARIKLETVLDKVAIQDAKKQHAAKLGEIDDAKQMLETQNIRKDAYTERLDGFKRIEQLEAKLKTESNKAKQERMKHKLEMEKREAEIKKRDADLQTVQTKYSKQKGKLDVLDERTQLLKEAAKIVGNDAVKQTPGAIVVTLRGLFKPKKTELEIYGKTVCEPIAKLIKKYDRYSILIEGHTDSRGSESTNLAKSQARAQSFMNQLLEHQVPISRMTATGRGEGVPISDNRTKDGKAANRRIELKFLFPAQD